MYWIISQICFLSYYNIPWKCASLAVLIKRKKRVQIKGLELDTETCIFSPQLWHLRAGQREFSGSPKDTWGQVQISTLVPQFHTSLHNDKPCVCILYTAEKVWSTLNTYISSFLVHSMLDSYRYNYSDLLVQFCYSCQKVHAFAGALPTEFGL